MKKAAVVGSTGKMGIEILSLAKESGFEITCGVSRKTSIEVLSAANVDVVIDFSMPELTKNVVAWCLANKKPLVSGVTGLGATEKELLKKLSQSLPVFWAPNMSVGVAVMARMLEQFSHLSGFDFQIEEIHHSQKKDSPSGTAIILQQKLEKSVAKPVPPPIAIRGGGVFGIHRVFALGEEETITIEHSAMNRRVFAKGALRAAKWVMNQPAGLYSMDELLGT
jgi:4-hydroxy-tetrahydrodipicolinate reductase